MQRSWRTHLAALILAGLDCLADGVRDETLRLVGSDLATDGKTVPKESKAKPQPKKPENKVFDAGDPEIVALPKFEITARPLDKLESALGELSREERREQKLTEPSTLDSILNNPKISIFGSYDAEARAARARRRIEMIDLERVLTVALAAEESPEGRARILADIRMLREMRR
jgi:hypothetical protein